MFLAKVTFHCAADIEDGILADKVTMFLCDWRANGQIHDAEWELARISTGCEVIVSIPESNSLATVHSSERVLQRFQELDSARIGRPEISIIGKQLYAGELCHCAQPSSLILMTTYLRFKSPLSCGDCGRAVPLYRIPHTSNGDYSDIIYWQHEYRVCDRMQMLTTGIEKAALDYMFQHTSEMNQRGIEVCKQITQLTAKSAYYFLYCYETTDVEADRARNCPSCGGHWRLEKPWHDYFDFRCDQCCLLSAEAVSVAE